jgi:hypothetical protein
VAPAGAGRYAQRFLARYESSDPKAMTGRTDGPLVPDDMLISSAADYDSGLVGSYCDTVVQHTKTPGEWPDADLITEWIEVAAATPANIDWYVTTRFPALMQGSNIVSGWLGKASEHQLYEAPRPAYIAIYRTRRLESAVREWRELDAASPAPWAKDPGLVMCFKQISDRITRLHVLDPDPVTRDTARAQRNAVNVLRRE